MDDQMKNNLRDPKTGTFSFTDTLNQLKNQSGLRGYVVDGARLDIGALPHVLQQDAWTK